MTKKLVEDYKLEAIFDREEEIWYVEDTTGNKAIGGNLYEAIHNLEMNLYPN